MSRVKKQLAALAVLFSIEVLSLGVLISGTFGWSNQHLPAAAQTDAGAIKLTSAAKTAGGFVFGRYGEPTPPSGIFLTAKETPGISVRSLVVSPLFFRIISAPKVSRYISKSVFNL
jgi:hypothetical protein